MVIFCLPPSSRDSLLSFGTTGKADDDAERARAIADLKAAAANAEQQRTKDRLVGMLFEAQNLEPGMAAPDIEGQDLDGVAFKLSDYRGKVVMLDFWGDW